MDLNTKRNPYLLFSPFLLYYIYYIIKHKWPILYGDEPRYLGYANNMLHGFYSPPAPDINLWSGPGYSIILMPFAAMHLPAIVLALLNAVFYYLSMVFLCKALSLVVKTNLAILISALWGFYTNLYQFLPALYTEIFTVLVVVGFIYSSLLFYTTQKRGFLILTGIILGYLALTKVIFGYVIPICLLICLGLMLFAKAKQHYKNSVWILSIAMLVTLPYLIYTYSLTKKVYYWGNAGGMSLYWMSSPYDLEYGDWKLPNLTNSLKPQPFKTTEGDSLLVANHSKEMDFILKHTGVEQDELFKKAAIANIKANPKKFVKNYLYNLSRMLFDFPYSYTYQITQTISNIFIGSFLFWASALAFVLTIINWKRVIYPVKFAMLVFVIYFFLSGLLSAYARQLDVVVPILLFWIVYMIGKLPKISLKITPADPGGVA